MFGFSLKDSRGIDQVIFDIAEHHRSRDHRRLFELLRGRELFTAIASSSVPIEHGRQLVVGSGDDIQLRIGTLPNGLVCAVFYVDRSDSRLGAQYAALNASEAFDMVSKTGIDALLIQNSQNSWVAFPRQELPAIRAKYL